MWSGRDWFVLIKFFWDMNLLPYASLLPGTSDVGAFHYLQMAVLLIIYREDREYSKPLKNGGERGKVKESM